MNGNVLLGKWVNQLLIDHFKEQREAQTEKLFIKITGLTSSNINALIAQLDNSFSQLDKYYNPVIRTITKIEGYEQFSYQNYETSTWLRNNTKPGEALILIINEITPESQSLENLFTIDESYLLANQGLESVYEVLSQDGNIVPHEISFVKKFLALYKEISEPQLRSIIQFLVSILNDNNASVIDRIHNHLPQLGLFVDRKLPISLEGLLRLKKNYALANLQINETQQERMKNNLYSFIEREEQNNLPDEIWELKSVEQLTEDAINFLDQKNHDFLAYDFEFVQKIIDFKVEPPTLREQMDDVLTVHKEQLDQEQQKDFEVGADEVLGGSDPDAIQQFVEDFEDQLDTQKGLVKKINRIVDKLRNPSVYEDIKDALLREIFILIEEQVEHEDIGNSTFILEVLTPKTKDTIVEALKTYLMGLNKVIPVITFRGLPEVDDTNKETDITFQLVHQVNGEQLGIRRFKITGLNNLEMFSFEAQSGVNSVPYLLNFAESDVDSLDVKQLVIDKTKNYIATKESDVEEHLKKFLDYLQGYSSVIKQIFEEGICSLAVGEIEQQLESILNNIYSSSLNVKNIYQYINVIGAIDYFEGKKGEAGVPSSRTLTVLNPIRLISYLKRYEEMSTIIVHWLQHAKEGTLEVIKLDDYLNFISSKVEALAPRYFSNESDDAHLIETNELFGEGTFYSTTKPPTNTDYMAQEVSEEIVKVVKNYLEVYPYAKDGLDVLMVYCQSIEVVTKSVDAIFNKTKVKKLKLTIHSNNAAKLHNQINKWLQQKEEYTKPSVGSKFPKVEINVIAGKNPSDIFEQIKKKMSDRDLVVLADYFGQEQQLKYKNEEINPHNTNNWFEPIYKEPLNDDEAVKRISYVSEHLPKTLQLFYQLQYIVQNKMMPSSDKVHVLKNVISITNSNHNQLIDNMHQLFNWVVILDRYLDKTLLTKTSSKASIIQYKSKAGKGNQFKLIVSSSKYIRKLAEQEKDHAYYDRLHRKLTSIMKNEGISREVVTDAVNHVKNISGALVLKVIGKGKYAHEMLATYLSTNRRSREEDEEKLQVWSSCDELPWFVSNKRRPDLVLTTIEKIDGKLKVHYELVELKFVNHNIFDKERHDALKQVKLGMNLYNNLFSFEKSQLDTDYWRSELMQYFIERSSYKPEHVQLLKEFQHLNIDDIEVEISGSIDSYCYTSNLTEYNFETVEANVLVEELGDSISNYLFNRSYILNKLKADEERLPAYETLSESNEDVLKNSLSSFIKENESHDEAAATIIDDASSAEDAIFLDEGHVVNDDDSMNSKLTDPPEEYRNEENTIPKSILGANEQNDTSIKTLNEEDLSYPEVIALQGLELDYEVSTANNEQLKEMYIKKLKLNFNQNNIHIQIKDAIIGSSVIRLIFSIPPNLTASKVTSRGKDIQLWLGLNDEPHIFINSQGMNIDIVREEPETVYFEKFMKLSREQLKGKIKKTNLIAPLGLNPLNQVIYMDFSESTSPHLLTGGTTGSGKSVTLNSIILGMMCLYSPQEVQFMFIDPKKVEFTIYENKQHTKDVITELDESIQVLKSLVDEMENRYTIFAKEQVTNLEEYIEAVGKQLPRIVLVFDEFADFMSQDAEMKKQVENAIVRLGQKARAAGIHLIICTQNPKADIVNTNIRNNLGARLGLKAADATASNIILDDSGAEKLAGKGDFLAKVNGQIERGKSPFLTAKVRRALLKYFNIKN